MSQVTTAPEPQKTAVKPEAKVDLTLSKLIQVESKAGKAAASATVAIIDHLKKYPQSAAPEVLVTTLMEAKKISKESAKVEASRYTKWLNPDNADKVEALRKGEITITAMRSIKTGSAAGRPRATAQEKGEKLINDAASHYVYLILHDNKAPSGSREAFLDLCSQFFDSEEEYYQKEKAEAQAEYEANQGKGNGNGEAGTVNGEAGTDADDQD
jgi:hypothetical protein